MSKRGDIIDGKEARGRKYGLIYTKKCGWIDLGHANPKGASDLLRDIRLANGSSGGGAYTVSYAQMMHKWGVGVGVRKPYRVKRTLTPKEIKSVALTIFLDVSQAFESMQGAWLFRQFTNSGFSAEDLMSNLLGFYRAAEPGKDYIALCEPVSKDVALGIWDRFGAVGDNKNRSPAPFLYPTDGSPGGPMCGVIPSFLDSIKPARKGDLFEDAR